MFLLFFFNWKKTVWLQVPKCKSWNGPSERVSIVGARLAGYIFHYKQKRLYHLSHPTVIFLSILLHAVSATIIRFMQNNVVQDISPELRISHEFKASPRLPSHSSGYSSDILIDLWTKLSSTHPTLNLRPKDLISGLSADNASWDWFHAFISKVYRRLNFWNFSIITSSALGI